MTEEGPTEKMYIRPDRIGGYDEDLIKQQLARNYSFFGEEGMAHVRAGTVVIVGCGGVGSWVAVMLVRSCVLGCIPLRPGSGLISILQRCLENTAH